MAAASGITSFPPPAASDPFLAAALRSSDFAHILPAAASPMNVEQHSNAFATLSGVPSVPAPPPPFSAVQQYMMQQQLPDVFVSAAVPSSLDVIAEQGGGGIHTLAPPLDDIPPPSFETVATEPPPGAFPTELDPTFVDAVPGDRKHRFNQLYETLYPFQREVFNRACLRSSIIYLPTGAGKTVIAAALAAHRHAMYPDKKVVFVVNRVPLISQQANVLHKFGLRVAQVCGDRRDARSWADVKENYEATVIIDSILIEMIGGYTTALFDDCSLIIFDEVHHARKSSNYAKILQMMGVANRPHVIGLSASPSARDTREKTRKALEELMGLTRCHVVTVLRETADLEQRVSTPQSELMEYAPNEVERVMDELIRIALRSIERTVLSMVRSESAAAGFVLDGCLGLPYGSPQYVMKAREAKAVAIQDKLIGCEAIASCLGALNYALILLEERSVHSAASRILNDTASAFILMGDEDAKQLDPLDRRILNYVHIVMVPLYHAILVQKTFIQAPVDHNHCSTKMTFLFRILEDFTRSDADDPEELQNFRGIVFCATKAATLDITTRLKNSPLGQRLCPEYFVGKSTTLVDISDEWIQQPPTAAGEAATRSLGAQSVSLKMNDVQQQRTLQRFRDGVTKLLIATSVAEEGLDIPTCNLVVRYEGFFSVQSFIQSRGRARKRNSRFIVISKMSAMNPFGEVLRDCAVQDQVIRDMCFMDQEAVIASTAPSTPLRVFEADPQTFLSYAQAEHGILIHMEDRPCRGGVQVVIRAKLPNGDCLQGTGIGNTQRAAHEARLRLVHQLYELGYIRPDTVIRSSALGSRMMSRFSYFSNPTVAVTKQNQVTDSTSTEFITEYDEEHYGKFIKPFVILDTELRKKGHAAPRAGPGPRSADDTPDVIVVKIEFQIREPNGEVKWYFLCGRGKTWEHALQNTALKALRNLKLNLVERPHSALNKNVPAVRQQ